MHILVFSFELLDNSVAIKESLITQLLDIGCWLRRDSDPTHTSYSFLHCHELIEHLTGASGLSECHHFIHFTTQGLEQLLEHILQSETHQETVNQYKYKSL